VPYGAEAAVILAPESNALERSPTAHAAPGIIGGRYQILNELGSGGMGEVFRVLDRLTGRVATLKRLKAAHTLESDSIGAADCRIALAQEFRLLATLRHPNIISVLDYGFDANGDPYFTMDLEENARTIIEAARGRPLAIQAELIAQALRALVYLHRHGIIHRDLKPENLVVVRDQVKLLDFGLSAHRTLVADDGGTAVGTPAYMAPEVLLGGAASERSDLYALGLIVYELLTGRYPFDDSTPAALYADALRTPLPRPTDELDERLIRLIARLLAKEPAQRYGAAEEVIRDLGQALGQSLPVETVATRESFLQAAPFVGRAAELAELNAAMLAAADGNGGTWLIGGESGVGKSRLLDEIRVQALARGIVVLGGQVVSRGGSPYHLWRDVRDQSAAARAGDAGAGGGAETDRAGHRQAGRLRRQRRPGGGCDRRAVAPDDRRRGAVRRRRPAGRGDPRRSAVGWQREPRHARLADPRRGDVAAATPRHLPHRRSAEARRDDRRRARHRPAPPRAG
jgi:hypothetical protein